MNTSSRVALLLIVLSIVVLTVCGAAYGQVPEPPAAADGDEYDAEGSAAVSDSLDLAGVDGDTTGVAVADSIAGGGAPVVRNENMEQFQNQGPGTRPRVAALEPEFHPVYKLTYNRAEGVGTWGHDFTTNYPISNALKFNSSASITIKEDEVLNRENRQESWRAGLNYNVTDAVGMGVRFNRSYQVETRNPGESTEVRTSREKETMDFSTSYNKKHFTGLSTIISASAGIERNDYADITSNGTTQDVSATLGYDIIEDLESKLTYTGRHSVLDSKQGDFESTDESVSHSLNATFDYEWAGHMFSADARRSYSETQYPKEGQTEQRDQENEGLDFSTEFQPFENLGMDFGYDYSRSQQYYAVETTRDSDVRSRSINGKLDYKLGETSFSAQLSSKKDRSDQFSIQTGDTYSDSFGTTITHTFGPRLNGTFRGSASLVSFHFDDPEANDQDRDLLNQEGVLTLTYKPRNDITADLLLRVKESQLIYIRTSRTGDNKTTNTYSIQPSIRKVISPAVSIIQKYELSADYFFYTYDTSSNSLIRNFNVTTDLSWRVMDRVNTTFTHKYRGQDEGAYTEGDDGIERYGKNSERDTHTLTVLVRYNLFGLIDLEVQQDYSVSMKWLFEGDSRRLSWEKHDTSIQGKASMNHDLEDGTTVRASVSRTLRDAPNISERQEDVWNASVSLERTF